MEVKVQQQKYCWDFWVLGTNKRGYFQSLWRESKMPGFLAATTFVLAPITPDQVKSIRKG